MGPTEAVDRATARHFLIPARSSSGFGIDDSCERRESQRIHLNIAITNTHVVSYLAQTRKPAPVIMNHLQRV